MAKNIQRSRNPVVIGNIGVDTVGHVRPESKPLINPEVAGRVSPKQISKDTLPGVVSPNSVKAGPY